MSDRLTRDAVVDAAIAIVQADGLAALSMRALCDKLDVAVTSIYWHVGNREALLDAVVERLCTTIVASPPTGDTPHERVLSTAFSMLRALETLGELAGVAHQRGLLAEVFAPVRRSLATEFAAAGLRGERLAYSVNAVTQYVAGHSITMSVLARIPEPERAPAPLWPDGAPVDDVAAGLLQEHPDQRIAFDVGLAALVRGLLVQ